MSEAERLRDAVAELWSSLTPTQRERFLDHLNTSGPVHLHIWIRWDSMGDWGYKCSLCGAQRQ